MLQGVEFWMVELVGGRLFVKAGRVGLTLMTGSCYRCWAGKLASKPG